MAMTSYLIIKGKTQGDIQGDCTQKGRENTILCYALEHSVEIPKDTHTGLPIGQRIHRPLKVLTHMGKHTPKISQACCTGEQLEVTLDMYHITEQGKEEKYFTIKLENAIVVNTKEYYPATFLEENKAYKHMQEIEMTYETITWTDVVNSIEAEDSWKTPRT